jgi:hypothetical protein
MVTFAAHPLEREHQVGERQIRGSREAFAGARQSSQPQIAERIQPVGECDDNDVVLSR